MNATKIALFGFIAYLGVKVFSKKQAAEKLQFFVHKINFRLSGLTPIIDMQIGIQNVTGEALTLGSMVGELYINNTYITNVSGFALTRIPGPGQALLTISGRMQIFGIVSEAVAIVQSVLNGGGLAALKGKQLRFKGNVLAEGVTVPADFTYNVL